MRSSSSRSAERRRAPRALSLIEVMVSQVIALVVISAVMSLVVGLVQKLNAEVAVSDAQVRLRQVTHLMLRDTQGVGSTTDSSVGDIAIVADGGASAADSFTLFKRDESVCGGGLEVSRTPGNVLKLNDIDTDPGTATSMSCPVGLETCPKSDIDGRTVLLLGKTSVQVTGHSANSSSCQFNLPTGQQRTDLFDSYNTRHGTSINNVSGLLDAIVPTHVLFGSGFIYRLSGTTLQRSTNNGATFVNILDNVADLQVERVYYDASPDTAKGLHFAQTSSGAALPAGFTEDEFLGLRIGIMTFATAKGDISVPPPSSFSNRDHTTAPTNRRYRSSFVFAASRNRSGA